MVGIYGKTGQSDASTSNTTTLRYADQNPENGWEAVHAAQPWLKSLEEVTGNSVRVNPYFSESLVKGVNAWGAVKNDIVDMAWMFHGYWGDLTPLANVISLPFLPFSSAKQSSGILWHLYEKYPSIQAEFRDNRLLTLWASTPYFLVTADKQVRTVDDIKGLNIRVTDGLPVKILQSLGAVPVTVSMPDTYLYLQKGLIDGMVTSWEGLLSFRQYELVKYYLDVPLFTVFFSIAINHDVWDNLEAEQKAGINRVCGLNGALFWGENMFDTVTQYYESHKHLYNITAYTLPPGELETWTESFGRPLWNDWVKEMEDRGHPEAQDILDTCLELIKTYQP